MSNLSSALVIPDSLLAKEATGILREHSSDLILYNEEVVELPIKAADPCGKAVARAH